MGILDDLKKWAHPYEDEDEEYEDDFPDLRDRGDTGAFADRRSAERKAEDRRNKVVNINATTQLKVVLVKPERFENASEIADHLKEKRTVVINLESTNKDIARRLIDFLSGVAYAGEGKIKKVAANTYIITPYHVDIMGDLGIQTTMAIVEDLRKKVKENHIKDPAECKDLLIASIKEQMDLGENAYEFENRKSVVLVIGVNGVGKTTSVGKLAGQLKDQGKKVILAAADTFRAAAIEQLTEWAGRAGVELIAQQEGSDPAAVIYDAIAAAKSRNADVLICDTAGRLHNKKNLMEELKKINRIIDKEYPDAYRETLVVLDGTTGQNALAQAKQFMEVADITGIILTKLDGTAKGGIAVAIQSELGIPVKYVGIGEKIDDLQKFDANDFVNALFKRNEALTENE